MRLSLPAFLCLAAITMGAMVISASGEPAGNAAAGRTFAQLSPKRIATLAMQSGDRDLAPTLPPHHFVFCMKGTRSKTLPRRSLKASSWGTQGSGKCRNLSSARLRSTILLRISNRWSGLKGPR